MPNSWRLRFFVGTVFLMNLINRVLGLVPAYALRLAVDAVSTQGAKPPFGAILLYFGVNIVSSLFGSIQSYCDELLSSEIMQQFAVEAFEKLVNLDLQFHMNKKSGNAFSIIWRGAFAVQRLMDTVLFGIAPT